MNYWRMNTDSEVGGKKKTCDIWYAYGAAFAGDVAGNERKHSAVFMMLAPGDGVFMHHNGLGLDGFGIVREEWDRKTYTESERLMYVKEPYEYRIPVDWAQCYDCRTNPLAIHGILPYMGAYSFIDPKKWKIESALDKMRSLMFTSVMNP